MIRATSLAYGSGTSADRIIDLFERAYTAA